MNNIHVRLSKVLAGIVTYNPDINRLKENIQAVSTQVGTILIVDNGSANFNDIANLIREFCDKDIKLKANNSNKGIAAALKQIMDFAYENSYLWVLSLDQDSVVMSGLVSRYLLFLEENTDKTIGILTCNIIDRNFEPITEQGSYQYKEVQFCITSASFMSVNAYKILTGYDVKMFIDYVDFDICLQMKQKGFSTVKLNYDGVLHEVGKGKNVRLLFKKYIAYNHSVFRQYYMARNHIYLAYKYPNEVSLFKEWIREFRSWAIIILYEDNKMKKIQSRIKGLKDIRKLRDSEKI